MNMWYDRDIDAKMKRTHMRPAASGELDQQGSFFRWDDNFLFGNWRGFGHRTRYTDWLFLQAGFLM